MMKKNLYSGMSIRDANIPKTVQMTGWRFAAYFGFVFGTVALMLYPIVVDPILHTNKYKEAHKKMQTELFQQGLLPGQLKKWEDPFAAVAKKK